MLYVDAGHVRDEVRDLVREEGGAELPLPEGRVTVAEAIVAPDGSSR